MHFRNAGEIGRAVQVDVAGRVVSGAFGVVDSFDKDTFVSLELLEAILLADVSYRRGDFGVGRPNDFCLRIPLADRSTAADRSRGCRSE